MIIPAIILAPSVLADAATDLTNLKGIVNAAAATIGRPTNSSRIWGSGAQSSESLGTAELVQNITQTVLNAKYNLDLDKVAWVNTTPITPPLPPAPTVPTVNDLYLEYINSIPNLSAALIAAGRTWHWEMNAPVSASIGALQPALTYFSTSLLEADIIDKTSILRTIRASSGLEDAQQAWSRILNLPGATKGGAARKRSVVGGEREARFKPARVKGAYTHKELWGREVRLGKVEREKLAKTYEAVVWPEGNAEGKGEQVRKLETPFTG